MVDNSWLTEEYMTSLGYYKVKDDGQYGEYLNFHWIVISPTYGNLPKDYRKINFNRDPNTGVFFCVRSDWDTRYSIVNVVATTKEIFETLLNACC